jgi:hypothetical protein
MAELITERNGQWLVGTQSFDSRQAAELYLQSRHAAPSITAWGAVKLLPWYVKALGILLVASAIATLTRPNPAQINRIEQARTDAAMARAEKIALLINMNGQLCARVTDAQYLHGNTYAITCTRYRDGTGSATYEVNLDTGQAR